MHRSLLTVLMIVLLVPCALQAHDDQVVQLVISQIEVQADIVYVPLDNRANWDVSNLGYDVGHLQGTGWIDQPGNIALAGHVALADHTPGIFARLHELTIGDQLLLLLPDGTRRIYEVDIIRVVGIRDLTPIYPTPDDRLTLITCHNFDPISANWLQRLTVSAVRVE